MNNLVPGDKNQFIKQWLAVVPDQVVVYDQSFEMVGVTPSVQNDLNPDFICQAVLQIKDHNFSEQPKLVIKNYQSGNKIYQIDVDCVSFLNDFFYYCKLSDITALENLNLELERSRAQQINIARLTELAELAGGISHEISNPLTIVMAKISYLQTKLSGLDMGPDKEKINDSLTKVIHHSNRITKIIKGLKNFSRNDDSEVLVKADLKELLDEAFLLTIENIKMKGIFLDMSGFDGRFMVSCRPVQLVQVLVNLLKNACDALEETRQPVIKIFSESDGETV